VRQNFLRELEYLLGEVPAEQWRDPDIRGVRYSFLPWHKMSSVTVQTAADNPRDPAGWKYYFSAESDGSRIRDEIALYDETCETDDLVYHRLLIEAAEALLAVDFGRYIPHMVTTDGAGLYKPFQVQVYHADRVFEFNYCEYVLARRLDTAEPGVAPDRRPL
jgi:hypothetical protein